MLAEANFSFLKRALVPEVMLDHIARGLATFAMRESISARFSHNLAA
jgi:hypothetical protein